MANRSNERSDEFGLCTYVNEKVGPGRNWNAIRTFRLASISGGITVSVMADAAIWEDL